MKRLKLEAQRETRKLELEAEAQRVTRKLEAEAEREARRVDFETRKAEADHMIRKIEIEKEIRLAEIKAQSAENFQATQSDSRAAEATSAQDNSLAGRTKRSNQIKIKSFICLNKNKNKTSRTQRLRQHW